MEKTRKDLVLYLLKFFGTFALLFYGTEAVIGFSAPGHRYDPIVAEYLNFVQPFRQLLLSASKALLSAWGFHPQLRDEFTLGLAGGRAVRIVYSCIGYGVLSFWIAFVIANRDSWRKKLLWAAGGSVAICALNVLRISLVLLAVNKGWPMPLGWDHHTWFNLICYLLIFAMIYAYDKRKNFPHPRGAQKPGTFEKQNHQAQSRWINLTQTQPSPKEQF